VASQEGLISMELVTITSIQHGLLGYVTIVILPSLRWKKHLLPKRW
jgi:hypothetical protein